MATDYQIVLNTCPDLVSAERLAKAILNQELAACVSMVPGIRSLYRWQGKIESSQEQLLVIKTKCSHYRSLEQLIQQLHPYELPEIIAVPIDQGLPSYLQWIDENLSTIHEDN